MSEGAPLALLGERPLRESALGATRALSRAGACLRAVCTELLTVAPAEADEAGRYHRAAWAAHRLARRLLDINGIQVTARGNVPSGPVILAANHLGYLDPVVIGALLPLQAIAKAEVASWPLMGSACTKLGTLFIRRDCAQDGARVLRAARRRLAAGVPVLNFPEGTTTDGSGTLLPFRRGLFGLARHHGARLVPVALRFRPREVAWIGGAAFLPHYVRTTARPSTQVTVRFGEPMQAAAFDSAEVCAGEVREAIARLLRGAL
jgi:1-acyl-sn-glycerol-3-phosphate acyltransferase